MSHGHNSNDPQALYEGDQSKLYSGVMNHHSDIKSEESRKQIGRIRWVLILLSLVTIAEVGLGLAFAYYYPDVLPRPLLNTIFLVLTLVKAGYIVSVFMHLGDEVKSFFWMVLMPLLLFVWFIIAFLADGNFWLFMNASTPIR